MATIHHYTFEFKPNLRALAKKYRSIRSDIQPLIGELPGDQVPVQLFCPVFFSHNTDNKSVTRSFLHPFRNPVKQLPVTFNS